MSPDGGDARPGADEVPALGAAPTFKLGVFYGALAITALVSGLPGTGDLPFYLVLLLLFAGIPILGHQTIGLTPYRARAPRIRLYWTLGVLYPIVVLSLGALLLLRLKPAGLSEREETSVQRAALLTLFVDREHARQLVFWSDEAHRSPTLVLLGEIGLTLDAQQPDTAALAMPIPMHLESLATLELHFRTSPDGWETWFKRFPVSSGIIALTRPELLPVLADGIARASVVVARTCGEHCHSAWRVTLKRTTDGVWRTCSVEPLTLPRD